MIGRNISRRILVSIILNFMISGCADNVSFQTSDPDSQRNSSGQNKSEQFTQGMNSKKLDILFVVDNSGSMSDEQQKMGEKINSFLDSLHDVDWQLAITTTDVSDGTYGLKGEFLTFEGTNSHVLSAKTPNYEHIFKKTIQRSESYNCSNNCPSATEQPLRASILAIEKRNTSNSGFFRNGADLGLMILSDEDEMSTGPSNATPATAVVDAAQLAWGDSKKIFTYGMVIVPGDTSCKSSNGVGSYGTFVTGLAALTGGMVGSICEKDYAPTLGLLANHARNLLDYVQLKYIPAPDSLAIKFLPEHTTTWRVDGRRIYFNNPPPKGTTIFTDYLVL